MPFPKFPPALTALLYFLFVLSLAVYGFYRPQPTWDLLGYVGAVISLGESDATAIHQQTYSLAELYLSTDDFQLLSCGNDYRLHVFANADSFVQQLPWYKIKPLYTGLAYVLSKIGFNLVHACLLISLMSFVYCSGLIFYWLRGRVDSLLFLVVGPLIVVAADLPSVGRLATPDALSAALLLASLYILIEKKFVSGFFLLIALSILARPDKIIPAFLILIWLGYFAPAGLRITHKRLASFAGILVGIVAVDQILSGAPGWGTLFHHAFIGEVYYPAERPVSISLADYGLAWARGIRDLAFRIPDNSFALFALLTFAMFRMTRSRGGQSVEISVSYLMLLSVVIQFVAYPFAGAIDRFSMGQHVFIAIAFMHVLHPHQPLSSNPSPATLNL